MFLHTVTLHIASGTSYDRQEIISGVKINSNTAAYFPDVEGQSGKTSAVATSG